LEVFRELDGAAQMEARRFVQFELPARLKDEQFLKEVAMLGAVNEAKHPELTVLRCFERIAFYQRKGSVEREVLYMVASGRIRIMWHCLQPVVEIHRRVLGAQVWINFEELDRATRGHLKQQGLDATELEKATLGEPPS
jgi:hypothetical protein